VASRGTLLDVAADLERRDREVAASLDGVRQLDARAETIRARSEDLCERVEAAPAQLAAIDRAHAEAAAAHERALEGLRSAETHLAEVVRGKRVDDEERIRAGRQLEVARASADDARARLERLDAERAEQLAAIAAARSEAPELLEGAAAVSGEIARVGRVSETGREPPPDRVDGLPDWASRVHAALFVVRGQLEQERERLVREANELGGAVLGEQVAGTSVALVRRRLEEALQR
jgi:chromosome segregation ATPase